MLVTERYFGRESTYNISWYNLSGLDFLFTPIANDSRPQCNTRLQLRDNVTGLPVIIVSGVQKRTVTTYFSWYHPTPAFRNKMPICQTVESRNN